MVQQGRLQDICNAACGTPAFIGGCVDHLVYTRVQNSTRAHHAGLKGDKQTRTGESMVADGLGGFTNGKYFSVRTGIIALKGPVISPANDLSAVLDHRPDRHFVILRGKPGLLQRGPHEMVLF